MPSPKLPGDLTWPKLLGTCLAAVTAAWVAGNVGFSNALTGAAVGSVIATVATAFFTTTIDKGHSVLVRTDRGSVVELSETSVLVDEQTGSTTVIPSQPDATESRWRRINWQAVVVATLLTLTVALLAITLYEEAVGRTWGSNEPGTTIGNTIGGPPSPSATPSESPSPSPSPTPSKTPSPSPSPEEPDSPTPNPAPSPSETTSPTPSPSPSPGDSDSTDPAPAAAS